TFSPAPSRFRPTTVLYITRTSSFRQILLFVRLIHETLGCVVIEFLLVCPDFDYYFCNMKKAQSKSSEFALFSIIN
ncbi:hypothetical protein, partial [Lactobacillus amylolyticus]|uniref:hypothetical protein n=1 Tax=Lactobacillus amylolyticus TaxID=83683 RepID=UPI0024903110